MSGLIYWLGWDLHQKRSNSSPKQKIQVLTEPAIINVHEILQIQNVPEWATKIVQFLCQGKVPKNKKEAQRVRMQSAWYTIINDVLYKKGYAIPLHKCL